MDIALYVRTCMKNSMTKILQKEAGGSEKVDRRGVGGTKARGRKRA